MVLLSDRVFVVDLALDFLVRWATPPAGGRLVQRSLRPLAGAAAAVLGVLVSGLTAGTLAACGSIFPSPTDR